MRATMTQVLEIPDSDLSVKAIEEAIQAATREFVSAAWQAAVHYVERRAAAEHPPGSLRVKGWERRTLWTSSGPASFRRRRFASEADGGSVLLFDLRAGLERWQRTTAAADRMLAETAAEASYTSTAAFWERAWGESPSATGVWLATQRVGRELLLARDRARRAVFEDGDLPGWEKPPPAFVGVEADSTYLGAWRGKGSSHEVYVGISYDGKEERYGRRRLAEKARCFGLRGSKRFGEDLFVTAQQAHNVTEAACGVYLSDGAASLRSIQEDHFARLTRQLDQRHAFERVGEAYGKDLAGRAAEVVELLRGGSHDEACGLVRSDGKRLRRRSEDLLGLAGYLDGPGRDLYGVRRLMEAGFELPEHLEGSGGVEREGGVLVGQRMKRRGMSWTRRGAENLLAVRQNLLNRRDAS